MSTNRRTSVAGELAVDAGGLEGTPADATRLVLAVLPVPRPRQLKWLG